MHQYSEETDSQMLSNYLAGCKRRIESRWHSSNTDNFSVETAFRIHGDGLVTDIELKRSSGSEYADRSALLAISAASPLPPLPDGAPYLDIYFVFQVGAAVPSCHSYDDELDLLYG